MLKIKYIALMLLLASLALSAQQSEWEKYKNEVRGYHYALNTTGTTNFSCLLTANFYVNFANSIGVDSSYQYPLKFIWTRDHDSYFVLQPLADSLADATRRKSLTQIQQIKNLFTEIFLDWKRFSLNSPFDMVPEDAEVVFTGDTVNVSFRIAEGGAPVRVKQTFTRGGQLGRISLKQNNIKHVNYPFYREVDGKWICVGWNSQSFEGDTVSSGLAVRLQFGKVQQIYLPHQFVLTAQQSDKPDVKTTIVFYLKDFALNEELEILKNIKSDSTSAN